MAAETCLSTVSMLF